MAALGHPRQHPVPVVVAASSTAKNGTNTLDCGAVVVGGAYQTTSPGFKGADHALQILTVDQRFIGAHTAVGLIRSITGLSFGR